MTNQQTLEKVTAFVTRLGQRGLELLVFDYPLAGVQVPAGSVEVGETPEAAVLREVFEETGLSETEIVSKLCIQELELPEQNRIALRTEPLLPAPRPEATSNKTLYRGLTVREERSELGFSLVVYEEYDLNQEPPTRLSRLGGWVPSSSLGTRMVRRFFHLVLRGSAPDSWENEADGHIFRPHWVPLSPKPDLVKGQDVWLDLVYEKLF